MKIVVLFVILSIYSVNLANSAALDDRFSVDDDAAKFLEDVNQRLAELYDKQVIAGWQNEIMGPNDLVAMVQSDIATKEIMTYLRSIASQVAKFKRLHISNADLRRQIEQIPEMGYEALGMEDQAKLYAATTNMSDIYVRAKLCSFDQPQQCNLTLVPDVQNLLHSSENVAEIEYYWLEWRRKTGTTAKRDFGTFIELYRKTANLNGFTKASDFWYKDLEENSESALNLLDKFMNDLQPLFQQFHAYVRSKLRQRYGEKLIPKFQPYPQHLAELFLGNAYRESEPDWHIDLPYSDVGLPNITRGLLERDLSNPQRVFWNVDDYFRSVGIPQLDKDFLDVNSKPKIDSKNGNDHCWHKAWKYYGSNTTQLSYCSTVDEEKFFNMFEVISDIYYIQSYRQQPTLFQEEPFPNFSDGIAKFFSLAASSPKYLEKLKLIEADKYQSYEARINRLYVQGLRIVFLLPIFYVLDRYRVEVLDGKLELSNNCDYWDLTDLYTGAEPPVLRNNDDFDAPAKLLMEVDDQYTSQIMSAVLQYQLFEHFCNVTDQYKKGDFDHPLDMCNLESHTEIGPIILKAMSFGSSKPYTELLHILTNESELKMSSLLQYFQPLYEWLLEYNRKHNIDIGWDKSDRCVK